MNQALGHASGRARTGASLLQFLSILSLVLLVAFVLVAKLSSRSSPYKIIGDQPAVPESIASISASETDAVQTEASVKARPEAAVNTNVLSDAPQNAGQYRLVQPTGPAWQLVKEYVNTSDNKELLRKLVLEGANAVPAIRYALLTKASPAATSEIDQANRSIRTAFIGALAEIGGAEAAATSLEVLRATADPYEVARLSEGLQKMEPGQHAQEAAAAALQLLESARSIPSQDQDLAPLFEVLQKYGGTEVVANLERASEQWKYYAAIALSQLPEGAGLPSLVRIAQSEDNTSQGMRDPALRMLAQLASQNADAQQTLLEQAKQNRISSFTWAAIAPILAGDQMGFTHSAFEGDASSVSKVDLKTTHLAFGNQNFYSGFDPTTLTAQQFAQRTGLLQKLSTLVSDPQAIQSLKTAGEILARRAPHS